MNCRKNGTRVCLVNMLEGKTAMNIMGCEGLRKRLRSRKEREKQENWDVQSKFEKIVNIKRCCGKAQSISEYFAPRQFLSPMPPKGSGACKQTFYGPIIYSFMPFLCQKDEPVLKKKNML